MSVDEWYPPIFCGECGVGEAYALAAVALYCPVCGFFCAGVAQWGDADDWGGGAAGDSLVSIGCVAAEVVEVDVFGGEDGDVQQTVGAGVEESGDKQEECEFFHGFLWLRLFFINGVAFDGAPDASVDVGDVPPAAFHFDVGEAYACGAVLFDGFV